MKVCAVSKLVMLNRNRISRNTESVSVIGINALNDLDTAPGTPEGILIAQPLFTKKRYSSADTKAVMIPRNIPSAPDRKSTRLNSSHVSISYAVFCLKKKTYSCYTAQWS